MWENFEASDTNVHLSLPDAQCSSLASQRQKKSSFVKHTFAFSHVFDHTVQQEDIFDKAAKGIVQGFLDGFNGTIFAYGQTGSGKTHTVDGSAHRFGDRGLTPRAISMIYQDLEKRSSAQLEFLVHVSHMEIYQESGYDLLTRARSCHLTVTPFPKVTVTEGGHGECVFRNLSLHQAASEEVAQALLFHGQANRKVAETSMNAQSSRSHSVFSIQLTTKSKTNNTIVRSKLHLVDLAGSERVAKTGTQGRHLVEAKYINLSLHHLEGVIIALHTEGSNSTTSKHVPYRNSLLTMVLRDSIGGNCHTAMIATISMEAENLAETLSTCRFAQRVACITNVVRKNEEINDKVTIQRLRHRISELEAEVSGLKSNHTVSKPVLTNDILFMM
ncbi:hypothetical protein CAPTEDRAFT_138763 [Capitella teleta]|uniref:Kinesin-like protein n=1 Tax=Capitella teleta TaxID=283909 RepID=R7VC59_CAPTE|nr:hypothetical protein CAPTEDRAFT_138763 [Capitella teleta]|eukprot:ELU16438.1 hypothetical protein CAPTEDRAFT_138763 [Capitella teleta]